MTKKPEPVSTAMAWAQVDSDGCIVDVSMFKTPMDHACRDWNKRT